MKHLILLTSLSISTFGQARFTSIDIQPIDEVEAQSQVRSMVVKPRLTTSQISMPTVSMRHLLMQAFGVTYPQITFSQNVPMGPVLADHSRYSLTAGVPKGESLTKVPEMLRSMLMDKFGLQYHMVTKPTLTISLRLSPTPKSYPFTGTKAPAKEPVIRTAPRGMQSIDPREAPTQRMYTWTVTDTAAGLAQFLSTRLRYLVVDNTGLQGIYVFVFSVKTGPILEIGDPLDEADIEIHYQLIRFQDAMLRMGLDLVGISQDMPNVVIDHLDMTPQ